MTKVVVAVALTVLALGAVYASVMPPPPPGVNINFNRADQSIILSNVPLVPGEPAVGVVRLPLDTLCRFEGPVTDVVTNYTCLVCYYDCLSVHNTLGGKCGVDPINTSQQTCLCANNPAQVTSQGVGTNAITTCNVNNPVIALSSPGVKLAVIKRMELDLCPRVNGVYDSTNCKNDCINNHGYSYNGTCEITQPLAPNTGTTKTLHCECLNSS